MDEKVEFQNFFEPFLGVRNLSLDNRTRNLAWRVYSIAVKEINKCVQKSKNGPQNQTQKELGPENLKCLLEHQKKSDSLKSQLKIILELFQEVDKARIEYLDHFGPWNSLRLQLVEQLKEITSSVDYDVYNWDIIQIIRRTLIIVGGITVFGPITIPPITLAAMPVAASGISGAVAIFVWRQLTRSGIVENTVLEEAQDIRDKDLESIKHLESLFESSEQLVKALTTLIGVPVLDIMMKDWYTFMHQLKDMHDEVWLGSMLKQWVRDVYSCWILQPRFGSQFAPIVITFVFVVLFLQKRNVVLLDSISKIRHFLTKRPLVTVGEENKDTGNQDTKNNDTGNKDTKNKDSFSKFVKIPDNLRMSDLVTVTKQLNDESLFLETVYNILNLSVNEEASCFDVFVQRKQTQQEIEKLKKRSPIIIFNVPCSVEESEIVDATEALLPPDSKGTVKFLKIMSGLLGNHWVLEIDKDHLPLVKKQKSIKVGYSNCRIEKYFGIYRCSKCQRFGHNSLNCKDEIVCPECAENHSAKHCASAKSLCINCVRFNLKNNTNYDTDHAVDGRKCKTYNNLKEHLQMGNTLASWLQMAG